MPLSDLPLSDTACAVSLRLFRDRGGERCAVGFTTAERLTELLGPHQRYYVGRHREAGDVLIPDAQLPADTRPGDLLAVPVSGAYHLSMASGYNLVGRPPLIGVRDSQARLLQRRETIDDILRRETEWALGR